MNTRSEILNKKKPTRSTLGRRDLLAVRGLKDETEYYYRWVNDIDERIPRLLEDGYTFVDKKGLAAGDITVESARGTDSLMRKGVGRGVIAYLMKIPRETYLAYKAEEQREVDSLEASMREKKGGGAYGQIDIERKTTA
jgi:hypothetical protein